MGLAVPVRSGAFGGLRRSAGAQRPFPRDRRLTFSRGLATLVALTIAAYVSVAFAGFVWDDRPLVVDNLVTHTLANTPVFFQVDLWEVAGGVEESSGYYRPLMLLSLAVDRALWGLSPAGHHLQSLAWHLSGTILFAVLLRTRVRPEAALAGAALFALHPVQSEAVVWIAARNDLMVASFSFAAVLALVRERLVLGGILALGAVFSKESGIFVFALLLAIQGREVRVRQFVPLVLAVGIWLGFRHGLAGVGGASTPGVQELGFLVERLPDVGAHYIQLLLLGWPLSVGASLEYLALPWGPRILLWTAALGLGVVLLRRGGATAARGVAFGALCLTPAVLAIAVRGQLGERYLYLPMAGLALAVAAALPQHRAVQWITAALALLSAVAIGQRLPDWSNSRTLFAAAVESHPNGASYAALGHELNDQPDGVASCAWFRMALEDEPAYAPVCQHAIRCGLKRGHIQEAGLGAELTETRCPRSPVQRGLESMVWLRLCDYERAQRIAGTEGLNDARLPLVLGVLASHRGDEAAYENIRSEVPDPASFDVQVQQLRAMCP